VTTVRCLTWVRAADVNLLKVPADASLPDDKVLFLSDIFATAWHACVLGEVADGDQVAIWGAGPGNPQVRLVCLANKLELAT